MITIKDVVGRVTALKMKNLSKVKLKSYQITILFSSISIFVTLLFAIILYMPLLRFAIKTQKVLKPGTEMRDIYLKLPMALDFRVYFFNVTNPLDVQQGQKPILKEIGPYCYDAFKEKIVIDENKKNDTLTYTPYDTYFFNETRSGKLSQDDYVTILNPLVVGIVNTVAATKPQFLGALNKALPLIFKDNYNIYLTTRVRDFLFDGVLIDCNVKDFTATAICSQFKGQSVMKPIDKKTYLFSVFGPRNGTSSQQITVLRGVKNGDAIGNVVAIDNHTDLAIWSNETCNEFRGTDGWIFPSFIKENLDIVAVDLCRTFKAKYVKNLKHNGVNVKQFVTMFGNYSESSEQCYCSKNGCLPDGIMDLTKCFGVPLLCSLPHFLGANQSVLQDVVGLHPEFEKHVIKIYFEPTTGTPVLGQRRIQFNLQLQAIQKISILKTVPEAIHPIIWLEEGVEIEGYLLNKVITVSSLLTMLEIGRYVFLAVSFVFLGYGCYQGFKEWKMSKISPVNNTIEDINNNSVNNAENIEFNDSESSKNGSLLKEQI